MKENYLYVSTLHTITNGKLKHGIANVRLKKFDKQYNFLYNMDTNKLNYKGRKGSRHTRKST